MKFLALNDDVKFIIASHLASDLKIRSLLSKNHGIQKKLFNEVVYNDDLNNYINLKYNAKENDNFKNGKIFKIYQDLPNTKDVVYIGSTCDTLKKCMTNFNIKSNSKVNYLRMYVIIRMYVLYIIRIYVYTYIHTYTAQTLHHTRSGNATNINQIHHLQNIIDSKLLVRRASLINVRHI